MGCYIYKSWYPQSKVYNRYIHKKNRKVPKDDAKDSDKILKKRAKEERKKGQDGNRYVHLNNYFKYK